MDDLQASTLADLEESGLFGDRLLQQILCSLLLAGRVSPTWTLAQVRELLDPEEVLAAALFFLQEKNDQPPATTDLDLARRADRPVDWAELFWRVQRLHPNEPRFAAENFGNCPTIWIEQVLRLDRDLEIERLDAEARAIANVGVAYAQVHGAPSPKTRHFNEFEAVLFRRAALAAIAPPVAAAFLRLHKKGKVPDWIHDYVDLEQVRASASIAEAG